VDDWEILVDRDVGMRLGRSLDHLDVMLEQRQPGSSTSTASTSCL